MNNNIKKVIFIGDIHADEINPKNRYDNYLDSICNKLDECFSIAVQKKVDAVILLGDLFNRMEPSGKCRNNILNILKKYNIPKYIIGGNHDIKNSIHNLPNSALGTLIATNILYYVDAIPELNIGIHHFKTNIEEELKNGLIQDSEYLIWAFHANISTEELPYNFIYYNQIKVNDKCKLIISGHLHHQMISNNINDKFKFINPGSICRKEYNEYNLVHIPQILLVEYTLDGSVLKTSFIKLKNYLPAEQIFKIAEIEKEKAEKQATLKYIQKIKEFNLLIENKTQEELLWESGKRKGVPEIIIKIAIDALKQVQETKNENNK